MTDPNPNVYIDENAVAAVDAKIRESKSMIQGVMSSWDKPLEGITSGPLGKITPPKAAEQQTEHAVQRISSQFGIVNIPVQAMKTFKQLLPLFGDIAVRLSPEQKKLFLEALESTPTPKIMLNAKAIFALMESLSK